MHPDTPAVIHLKDYAPPAWLIDTVDLHVAIQAGYAEVTTRLACRRNPAGRGGDLVLNGEELELLAVSLEGTALPAARYQLDAATLTLAGPLPESFSLETQVRIDPDRNTRLSGLYRSKDGYFTQCEAEGFRRITFFPDRPDVMARFTCTVEADRERFPQLLSNGNLVASGELEHGRHWARWQDPFAKPCYLFALVAAKLDVLEDRYVTASGRSVDLAVYVEPGKLDQCGYAMAALKKSMRWDEQRFGLEMDLDRYMIVAVGDFNMGAMENKGLNIFNTKYVLARPDTATDLDYQNIDRVVAHEYFHNWTGNRVTCRDWFQLSLKEGLTVFRDQEFGADVHSRAVTRIQEVRALRIGQFPEDAGPMAHPIRPASYAQIDNFYTATVYNKGAEVVRMIQTLTGQAGFRAGMDIYFQRHDGQAVTCDDFVSAMQDASGVDLSQFRRWYARAGTPHLAAQGQWDAGNRRYTLTLRQTLATTAYERRQQEAGFAIDAGPLHIPVALGLVLPDGRDAPLRLAGELAAELAYEVAAAGAGTRVLSLTEAEQTFVFEDIEAAPVASLLRDYSAPVHLDFAQTDAELAHLMAHDTDAFNRWEAGQRLATRVLLAGVAAQGEGTDWIPEAYVTAVGRVLESGLQHDPALAAEALILPAEQVIAEEVAARGEVIDPEIIHRARIGLRRHLAARLREGFEAVWAALAPTADYSPDAAQVGQRALRNVCLGYLAEGDALAACRTLGSDSEKWPRRDQFSTISPGNGRTIAQEMGEKWAGAVALQPEIPKSDRLLGRDVLPRLIAQCETGGNMTDVMAALATLANLDLPERETALAAFYAKWKDEALVVDKWLSVQATSRLPGTGERVRALLQHPAFDLKNPNKVYSLVRGFANNPRHFHAADGSGYALVADVIVELQAMNPQVASRLARAYDRWRQFDSGRQTHARAALQRIAACENLAADVAEVVGNALK